MAGPLAGVRVLDLTTIVLGPSASQMLGDMGADVIKVEPPAGDPTRQVGPGRHGDMSAQFMNVNRNKRSLVLDLKNPAAREALLKLAAGADVFLHTMRPGAIRRLGLDYDALCAANPRIIYCGAYGYREDGPYAGRPAYDDMIQAESGIAALEGRLSDRPRYSANIMADKVMGLMTANCVALALYHRERTGEGQAVEVPMFETMVAFALLEHQWGHVFDPPLAPPGYPRALIDERRPYRTKDGHIGVLPHNDRQWRAFFRVAGRSELMADPRFADIASRTRNIADLYGTLAEILTTRTTDDWLRALRAANVPSTRINGLDDLFDDPHLNAIGFWRRMAHPTEGPLTVMDVAPQFAKSPGDIRRLPPRLGEHSREVLAEAGLGPKAIDGLFAAGAAVEPGRDEP